MAAERVTVNDVAQWAGVSRQTVSNVFNNPDIVRADTRTRVESAVAELGYRPLPAARLLRSGKSRTIGLALATTPRSRSGISDRFLHALTAIAQERDHRILLFVAGTDEEETRRYEELLTDDVVDAFVLTDTHPADERVAWLLERGARFATFGRGWDSAQSDDHDWVDVDGAAGTREAVNSLYARGHERIGFIGWPSDSAGGDDRRRGWQETMRACELATGGLDRSCANNPIEGMRAAVSLMDAGATGLVCASDDLAIGALPAARLRNVAVIGFDDTEVAHAVGLSSFSQPLEDAARMLLDYLLSVPAGPRNCLLTPKFVERESSLGSRG